MNIQGRKISNIGSFKIGGNEYDIYIAKTKEQKKKVYSSLIHFQMTKECFLQILKMILRGFI